MTGLSAATVAACLWTAATVTIRAEMLRKRLDPRPDIPRPTYQGNWPTIVCMDLAALGFVGWALEISRHADRVGIGAAFCAATCAIASSAMLVSMIGHNWRERIRREAEIRAAQIDDGGRDV